MKHANLTIDHVGVVVPDVDAYVRSMRPILGNWVTLRRIRNEAQQVDELFISDGHSVLEVMAPLCEGSPVDSFLRQHPTGGVAHVCYDCDGIDDVLGSIGPAGKLVSGPIADPGHGGRRVAFVFLAGQLIELVERDTWQTGS